MPRRLTLIAGSGALVPIMAAAARRNGDALQVIDLVNRGDIDGDTVEHLTLAQAPALLAAVKTFRTSHAVLAGAVHISDADREGLVSAFGFAGKVARVAGDIGIASMILLFCRMNRIKLIGAHEIAPELLAPDGHIAGPPLDPSLTQSAQIAIDAARAIGRIDLGQSVLVSGNRPVAAEDTQGTDALLARAMALRAAGLIGNSGLPLILAKAKKPKQPSFVDLPAIGVQTVISASEAGIGIIVVEAKATLLIDRAGIEREAAARGVTIVGRQHG
ncbi:MAG: UDP-2,3-diacylglucosamine diphosphatase LpxI [Devosia sp.]